MDKKEQFSFFYELIRTNYEVFFWHYDSSLTPIDSTSICRDIINDVGFTNALQNHISLGRTKPLILETMIGLVWIAGFIYENGKLTDVYLIGPSFTGRDTAMILLKKLDHYDLSVRSRSAITKQISETPIIPTNTLIQYATMLHYTLNSEKILMNDVLYAIPSTKECFDDFEEIPDEHNGIWMNEQKLCKMFEEGNPNYKEALSASFAISSGIKADIRDALRKHKGNALVLLTLCSRSCMKGGLNPSIAYSLNDYYAKLIEECNSMSEVAKLCDDMLADYMSRMQQKNEAQNISSHIQNSCYYIKQHLTDNISIEELASRYGYTEYYFSHKFKKETGYSINDYILQEKLEQAKLLLTGTTQSIQDISDSLAFCNRSYFYSCFRKKNGLSPSEYRKKNAQL